MTKSRSSLPQEGGVALEAREDRDVVEERVQKVQRVQRVQRVVVSPFGR